MRTRLAWLIIGIAALGSACSSGGGGDDDDDGGEGGDGAQGGSTSGGTGGGTGGSTGGSGTGGAKGGTGGSSAAGKSSGGTANSATGGAAPQPPRDPLDLNAPAGTLGGRCEHDADCADDLKCLAPAGFASGTRYCAPTCTVPDDCQAFANTSYGISVPLDPDGFGDNAWGTTLLARGAGCAVSPELGGTQKYCQFLCVENSAANADFTSCSCLPRYERITNDADELVRCDWSDASQCSPLNYPGRRNVCDACNSEPLIDGCYTGRYFCSFNRNFNGNCMDGSLDVDTLESCVDSSTSDCDPVCFENCTGGDTPNFDASDICLDACCKTSDRPATEKPECTSDPSGNGGTGGTGGTGGSSGSAGSSAGGASQGGGTSSGGTSGGSSSGGTGSAGKPASGGTGSAAGGASSGGTGSGSAGGPAGGGAPAMGGSKGGSGGTSGGAPGAAGA